MRRQIVSLTVLLAVALAPLRGQAQRADSPGDSLFLRARRLVLEGNGARGRALVDSALTAAAGTPDYATALYWRGSLAATAADAERDYRRVIVEYPFSPHSGDALLALAQLEMARGDRDPAIDHLQRFLLQRPNDPERIRAGIWLGRLLLDQNQLARGCAVLLRTRSALGDTAVETRNQVDYYAARCAGVDTTAPVARPAALPARVPQPPVAPNVAAAPSAKRYTVQVAAYQTRDSAEHLVTRLGARGIVARVVSGSSAPYRVRVGHYASDAEATAEARALKEKGIAGFVTTTDNETMPAPVRR